MSYAWKITLNSIDISDKVSGFSITCYLDNYCREMTLDINDPDMYALFDFSQVSESPEIEIFTKNGSSFISQGQFFIERPAISSTPTSDTLQGIWGRSITAMLAEPFAPKITKAWETQTTFFGICEEMCDLAGFTWSPDYSDIADFVIYPYTYEAENLYPIDVITELAALAGVVVTTDLAGHLCIKEVVYSPSVANKTITDADITEISESPEWPVFANRLRITPTGSIASYGMDMIIPEQCMAAGATAKHKIFVRVTDSDGEPVDGIVVNWTDDAVSASLQNATSNTQDVIIKNEKQQATGYYDLKVDMPPSSILGVYAAADTAKANNFAAAGFTLDGENVTLNSKLKFCDQSLIIDYIVGGIAVNYLQAGSVAEDVMVTADVEGQRASKTIYINNPCQCAPVVKLSAAPTSVQIAGQSQLLVYVEEGGPVEDGRLVYMSEQTSIHKGRLRWTTARLGSVLVSGEKTVSINEINGISQCEISMYPSSITSVYQVNANGISFGPNLYSSHDGKIITLTTVIASELDLKVWYYAQGVARNLFTGSRIGKALIKASIESSREAGASDSIEIDVENKEDPEGTPPGDYDPGEDDGDYGGPGGTEDDEDDEYDPNAEDPATEEADFNWCIPDAGITVDRFAEGLAHDCSCEEMCNTEFDIYGTTQGYDGGSGKKISALALEQCGTGCEEGSPAYWEKYAELKAAAIANCVAQCDACVGVDPLAWDTVNNPETIVAGSSVSVAVTGGLGPYTWSTSNNGYTLLASETETGGNQVICGEGICGTDYDAAVEISITDACGTTITGALRNTGGQWVWIAEAVLSGEPAGGYCDSSDCVTSTGATITEGEHKWKFPGVLSRRACQKFTGGWTQMSGEGWIDPPCEGSDACLALTNPSTSGCGSASGCAEGYSCEFMFGAPISLYQWGC